MDLMHISVYLSQYVRMCPDVVRCQMMLNLVAAKVGLIFFLFVLPYNIAFFFSQSLCCESSGQIEMNEEVSFFFFLHFAVLLCLSEHRLTRPV